MTWSNSAMFGQFLFKPLLNAAADNGGATGYAGLAADAVKAALFNNTGTPDKNAAVGLTGYNAATSQWVVANEVIDTLNTNWVAGGVALTSKAISSVANGTMFDAADTPGAGTLTVTNAFGALVYDSSITAGTVAKQGICFNYFGGGQTVTAGTFTIVWNTSGLFQITA